MTELSPLSRRKMLSLLAASGAYPFLYNLQALNQLAPSNYSEIMTRKIPSSGEAIPVVGMGTWETFDVGNDQESRANLKKVLNAFVDLGGKVVDSSPMYNRSEKVVGEIAKELGVLDKLFMATKVWTSGKEAGIAQMESSMNKMCRNPIDLMQVHNLLDLDTHLKTLCDWKEAGKVRYIGITHYTDSSHERLTRLVETQPFDFVQINYSIQSRNIEKRLLPAAIENDVAVIINRPYEGGSLFRKVKGKVLPGWAADYDIHSWGQYFLKYILSHPGITCVIPATSKEHHMRDNMSAGYGELPDKKGRAKMVGWLKNI